MHWLRRKRREQDLERELRSDLELETAEQQENGLTPDKARYAAQRAFGNTTLVKEEVRELWQGRLMEQIAQDLRYGFRTLRSAPTFTIVAVLTLGLGIGANAAIFSVIEAVLLRALPYQDPSRLVLLADPKDLDEGGMLYRDFDIWKSQGRTFDSMAIYFRDSGWSQVTLTNQGDPYTIQGAFVSANFFSVMGVSPVVGRTFTKEEEVRRERVILLSHDIWTSRFGRSPDVVGQSLQIDGANCQIIGVMPASFQFPGKDSEFWAPITINRYWNDPAVLTNDPNHVRGFYARWQVIGRLRPGVTHHQAQSEMDAIARRVGQADPNPHRASGIAVIPLQIKIGGNTRLAFVVLFVAVCLVLLIACSNVANLVLARGAVRQREISVRIALGAGRRRILRQLLTENILLTSLAAGFGIALTAIGIRALIALAPPGIPRLENTHIDGGVLVFTLSVAVLSTVLFGLAPAWKSSHSDPNESLKSGARGTLNSTRLRNMRNVLVIAEFSLAVILLAGAGLLLRSYFLVNAVNLGFHPEHVLTMHITLPANTTPARAQLLDELTLARARSLPGVRAVGAIDGLFSIGGVRDFGLRTIEGRAPESRMQWMPLAWTAVRGDYFQSVGTRLLKGRFFSDRDTANSPLAVIINENVARRYWPGENPVGMRFKGFDRRGSNDDWLAVIGVVQNMRTNGLDRQPAGQIYQWYRQSHDHTPDLVVRTFGDPLALAGVLRNEMRHLDRTAILSSVSTLEQQLSDQLVPRRFETVLLGLFSLTALLLACVGIYGLIHYSVTQRTSEIGLRVALGAKSAAVQRMVLSEALKFTSIGLSVGLAGAVGLNRLFAGLLYGVKPWDAPTLICVSVLLITTALIASYLPARRAARIDPLIALRQD